MSPRRRLLLAALVALVPHGGARIALYRRLLGYTIGPDSRIGMLNLIACRSLRLGPGAIIGRGNLLKGDFDLEAGPRFFLGNRNSLTCPWGLAARDPSRGYATHISFGADCLVNDRHFLDAHGAIRVGDGSWIAGRDSQIYTHGAGAPARDVEIGRGCFLGSAVRFAPGAGVGDRCIVAMGAVVSHRLPEATALIAGVPARAVRDLSAAHAAGRFRFTRADWGADAP